MNKAKQKHTPAGRQQIGQKREWRKGKIGRGG